MKTTSPDARYKLQLIQTRITEEDRGLLERAAALAGLPTSTWLRELGLNAAREVIAKFESRTTAAVQDSTERPDPFADD